MIKLIVSDVDGTILRRGEETVREAVFDAIRALTDKGIAFCLSSGRGYGSLRSLFAPVADRVYFACHYGAVYLKDGRVLYHRPIKAEDITRFVRADAYRDKNVMLCGADRTYLLHCAPAFQDMLISQGVGELCRVSSATEIKEPIYKLGAYCNKRQPVAMPMPSGELRVAYEGDGWIEYVPRYANKGTALTDLQMRLFAGKYDTLAIGNDHHDIDLMRNAKYTVCMKGSSDELRRVCEREAEDILAVLEEMRIC